MNGPITNRHGEKLDYRFHQAESSAAPSHVVLIGHGVTAHLDRPFVKALAEGLAEAGLSALRFSFSGNGESEGDFRDSCVSREVDDLGSVIDAVTAAGHEVSYVGHSMGGAVGVLCAAKDQRIRFLVSLAGMVETKRFAETEFGEAEPDKGSMWDEPSCPLSSTFMNDLRNIGTTAGAAAMLGVPFLMVHGLRDDLVPIEESRMLLQAGAGEPGMLIELDADHVFSGESTAEMVREVIHWLVGRVTGS